MLLKKKKTFPGFAHPNFHNSPGENYGAVAQAFVAFTTAYYKVCSSVGDREN